MQLQGVAGVRGMRVWLSGSRGDDEFVALLRRLIKRAYKGQNLLLDSPPGPNSDAPGRQAAATEVSRTVV